MKKCTITFTFGSTTHSIIVPEEELYGTEGERSLSTGDFQGRLLSIITKRKSEWNTIKNDIIQSLKDNSAISNAVTSNLILGKAGKVPNVNFKYIQDLYPEVDFPSVDVPILMLDNLDLNIKGAVSSRDIDKNGKEIFVVRSDKKSIVKLGEYLKIREKVKSQEYMDSLEDEDIEVLNKLANQEKVSVDELLLTYLNNPKKIRESKTIIDGKSAYVLLDLIARMIKDVPQKRKFKHPLLNEFNYRLKGDKDGGVKIKLTELTKQLNTRYPKLFPTQKGIKELINKSGKALVKSLEEIKNLSDEEKALLLNFKDLLDQYLATHEDEDADIWGVTLVFNALNSLVESDENPLSIKPVRIDKNYIYFDNKFPTLKSLYGLNYDTVASFTREETRNGYNIYSQSKEIDNRTQTYYYVTPYLINENLGAPRFSSLELAQEWVDEHYLTLKLRNGALVDLKQSWNGGELDPRKSRTFKGPNYIPEGTIITSIDIPIDIRSTNMLEQEYRLIDKSLQDFYDYIDTFDIPSDSKSNIKSKINTAEKALIFLSEINRELNTVNEENQTIYPRTDSTKMVNIATKISTKTPKYYYISKIYSTEDGEYRAHFIETDETATTTLRKEKRTPIIQLLNGIAKVMQDKFGVEVVVADADVLNSFNEDLNTTRAFIRDGKIYINRYIAKASDAFHEYAHLFLGAMKANPEFRLNYLDFIDKVLSTEDGQKALAKKMRNFPEAKRIDLAEEVVADLYGLYMENNLPYELNTLFATNDTIKKIQNTIFDKKDRKKTVLEFDGSLKGIWQHFNSEVAKSLSDNISFIKDEAIQTQRKKANWISKKIDDGEIREDCKS